MKNRIRSLRRKAGLSQVELGHGVTFGVRQARRFGALALYVSWAILAATR